MYLINNDHPSHTVAQITSVIPVTLVTPVTSVTPATPLTLSLQHVTSLKIQIKRFALFTLSCSPNMIITIQFIPSVSGKDHEINLQTFSRAAS